MHNVLSYRGGMASSRHTMAWLTVWLLGGLGVAIATLAAAGPHAPTWVSPLALTIAGVSLAGPVLILGWMLGRVFARAGGMVGALLTAGLTTAAAGQAFGVAAAAWAGWGGVATAATGLVLLACRHRIARSLRRRHQRRAAKRKAAIVVRLRRRAARTRARAGRRPAHTGD